MPSGTSPRDGGAKGLEQRIEEGLAPVEGSRIEVPEEARPLVRVVAAMFDEYLGESQTRHSRPLVTFREAADQGGKR